MNLVTIKNGIFRNKPFTGTYQVGPLEGFLIRANGPKAGKVQIYIDGKNLAAIWANKRDVQFHTGKASDVTAVAPKNSEAATELVEELETGDENQLSDAELGAIIEKRFIVMDKLTNGIIEGKVKSLIISGASGVGKSYELSEKLAKAADQNKIKYSVMSGTTTAIGLYKTLFKHSMKNEILILDDIDRIFGDEDAINVLKAALDTGKTRTITWMSESRALKEEDIPSSFEFNGSVVFITNLNFDKALDGKTRIAPHIKALLSRTVYLDLCIHTLREIMIRIEQVISKGDILAHKNIDNKQKKDIIEWIRINHRKFRTLSLREVLHLGDMVSVDPVKWKELAEVVMFDPRKMNIV